MGRIWEITVELCSGAMIYTPRFIKIGLVIQKLIWGDSQTHRKHGDLISLLLLFKNKESRLINEAFPNQRRSNMQASLSYGSFFSFNSCHKIAPQTRELDENQGRVVGMDGNYISNRIYCAVMLKIIIN
jgi:hypothetical protein